MRDNKIVGVALVAFAALTAEAIAANRPEPAARPNVFFIFADDQRADTIAGLGHVYIQTPNPDRLMCRGVALNRAYMMGGMNAATCPRAGLAA